MLFSCQRQKKNPQVEQNTAKLVFVNSPKDGGSEWLLAEDISGIAGDKAVCSSSEKSPTTT